MLPTDRIRQLIGKTFNYQNAQWQLIEVLPAENRVVLQCLEKTGRQLQTSQYGEAKRHVPETLCLPISAHEDSNNYSEALLQLLTGIQKVDNRRS